MQYLTYEEYKELGGEVCDLTAFKRYISRACGIIRKETHNRIEQMKETPVEVKFACREIIEYLAKNVTDGKITSKSQTAGAISESESYIIKSVDDVQNEIDSILLDYLSGVTDHKGTPILYRGCCV